MTGKPIKRRKRAIPGRAQEQKKVMVYLYEDEHALIYKAAVSHGLSVSGYMALAAMEKANRNT